MALEVCLFFKNAPLSVARCSARAASYGLVGFLDAGSPEPNVNFVREFRERASLFRLDVGELDHLGPRSSATQIGKSSLCRYPASPKYDRYGFR